MSQTLPEKTVCWDAVGALLAWKGEQRVRDANIRANILQSFWYRRRCYNTATKALVAIKSMPKEHRIAYNHLLTNEVHTLSSANIWQVPRVNRFIDQGLSSSGDRCLILEYALLLTIPYN